MRTKKTKIQKKLKVAIIGLIINVIGAIISGLTIYINIEDSNLSELFTWITAGWLFLISLDCLIIIRYINKDIKIIK